MPKYTIFSGFGAGNAAMARVPTYFFLFSQVEVIIKLHAKNQLSRSNIKCLNPFLIIDFNENRRFSAVSVHILAVTFQDYLI